MQNPVHSPDRAGSFTNGFFSGAKSGALMMGIFNGVMGVAGLVGLVNPPALAAALTMMALGTLSTGLFSGISAMNKANTAAHSAHLISQPAERAPVKAPEHYVAPQQAVEQGIAQQQQWTQRVAPQKQDRVSQILADGKSAQEHASAILAEREQGTAVGPTLH